MYDAPGCGCKPHRGIAALAASRPEMGAANFSPVLTLEAGMGDVSDKPEFFVGMERLAEEATLKVKWERHRKWFASSGLAHFLVLLLMIAGPLAQWLSDEPFIPGEIIIRFWDPGGSGQGGGGGGGGDHGDRITAFIPVRNELPEPEAEEPETRQAPVAPRKPPQLNFDELTIPDLPTEMDPSLRRYILPRRTAVSGAVANRFSRLRRPRHHGECRHRGRYRGR